jgi:L-ascorbate metabolism protein UlaG (beta-lactamase superfamily)
MADMKGVKFTWLGHSTFRIRTPGGKTILIDPWVMNNPACPEEQKKVAKLDTMLVTHGHGDHIGDAADLAKQHKAIVVGVYELCMWLQKRRGVEKTAPMNKGGSQQVGDIRVTMVHADHSCGIEDDGQIVYGGEPCGYVVEFESGLKIYHAGDTGLFGDMRLIHELYQPHVAFLPIGDLYTMGPREAAYACGLLRVKTVVPMHFGTFPALTGTPAQLHDLVAPAGVEVVDLQPGETVG